jgi:hypothetical protein
MYIWKKKKKAARQMWWVGHICEHSTWEAAVGRSLRITWLPSDTVLKTKISQVQWLKSVILATYEAEIRTIEVHKAPSQPTAGHSGGGLP